MNQSVRNARPLKRWAIILGIAYLILQHAPCFTYAFWFTSPLFVKDLFVIRKQLERGVPDRLLPRQVLHTLLLTLMFGLLLNHNLLGF